MQFDCNPQQNRVPIPITVYIVLHNPPTCTYSTCRTTTPMAPWHHHNQTTSWHEEDFIRGIVWLNEAKISFHARHLTCAGGSSGRAWPSSSHLIPGLPPGYFCRPSAEHPQVRFKDSGCGACVNFSRRPLHIWPR